MDAQILDEEAWQSIGKHGFDDCQFFGAYIHTLRWNCVTATNPRLFQSIFRAGNATPIEGIITQWDAARYPAPKPDRFLKNQ